MARRVAFRKKRQNKIGMASVALVVLVVLAVLSVKSVELNNRREEYLKTKTEYENKIAEEQERTQKLEEYEKYTKTAKYVEEIAKEKLGLVYEDEIIFKSDIAQQEQNN